jgi:hypothetical protein
MNHRGLVTNQKPTKVRLLGLIKIDRIRYIILKINTGLAFYFFALTQKSNKKSQGYEKMTKNYFAYLNPANSPLDSQINKKLLAQTTPAS